MVIIVCFFPIGHRRTIKKTDAGTKQDAREQHAPAADVAALPVRFTGLCVIASRLHSHPRWECTVSSHSIGGSAPTGPVRAQKATPASGVTAASGTPGTLKCREARGPSKAFRANTSAGRERPNGPRPRAKGNASERRNGHIGRTRHLKMPGGPRPEQGVPRQHKRRAGAPQRPPFARKRQRQRAA